MNDKRAVARSEIESVTRVCCRAVCTMMSVHKCELQRCVALRAFCLVAKLWTGRRQRSLRSRRARMAWTGGNSGIMGDEAGIVRLMSTRRATCRGWIWNYLQNSNSCVIKKKLI